VTLSFDFPGGPRNFLLTFDGGIEESLCEEFLDACKQHYDVMFEPGPTWGGVRPNMKKSMDATLDSRWLQEKGLSSVSVFESMRTKAQQAMYTAIAKYVEQYRELWNAPGLCDTGFRLQHYHQAGGWYRQHCDATPWEKYASGDDLPRVLAILVYLNTVESGGGTKFPEQDQIVSAVAGRVAVFPTAWTHPHLGLTPLSSDKFIFSSFVTCDNVQSDSEQGRYQNAIATPLKVDTEPEDSIETEDQIVKKDN
jgi:hypothetical protein